MKLPSPDANWYVVTTKSRSEAIAAEELNDGGFETYLPVRRVRGFLQRRRRLIVEFHKPLMPGYLFLATERHRTVPWGWIRDNRLMRHVGRPLHGSDGPLRIPSQLVIQISVDEMAGEFDETGSTKRENHRKLVDRFTEGSKFRITEGVFQNYMALAECVTAQDRIRVLVTLFGRLTTVEFDPHQLEAVA